MLKYLLLLFILGFWGDDLLCRGYLGRNCAYCDNGYIDSNGVCQNPK